MKNTYTVLISLFLFISTQSVAQNLFDFNRQLKFDAAFDLHIDDNVFASKIATDLLLGERHEARENNAWVKRDSVEYTYDTNGNQTNLKFLFWNGTSWTPSSQRVSEYDDMGLLTKMILQTVVDSDWLNNTQILYFNENGLRIAEEIYGFTNNSWTKVGGKIYEYDKSNNLISELSQKYEAGNFVNDKLLTFEYDDLNNQTSWLNQNWNGLEWVNFRQAFLTYDGQNNVVENYNQTWLNDNWINGWNYLFVYNEDNLRTEITSQNWVDSTATWKNIWLNRYEFNGLNNLEFAYQDDWEEDLKTWENDVKISYEYDTNDNLAYLSNQRWQNDNWQFFTRSFYFYGMSTSFNELEVLENGLTLFPNPNSGTFTLNFSKPIEDGVLNIFNTSGQVILKQNLHRSVDKMTIDLSGQISGFYYLTFKERNTFQTIHFVKY